MGKYRVTTKPKKRLKWLILLIAFLLIGSVGTYAASIAIKTNQTGKKIYRAIPETTKREEPVVVKEDKPISVLLLGVDLPTKNDIGRSDTMMILTLNPKTKKITIVSIPRDLRVKINGVPPERQVGPKLNGYYKINAAYEMGGPELACKTVEEVFDIPIDKFITIQWTAFVKVVDALGGVDVNNKFRFVEDGIPIEAGNVHLNGIEALQYARMRHSDILHDYGRQNRQREIVEKLIEKGSSMSVITKLSEILDIVGDGVTTNFSIEEMWDIKGKYAGSSTESLSVEGVSAKVGAPGGKKYDYELMLYDEQIRITELLRTELNLSLKDRSEYPNIDDELYNR